MASSYEMPFGTASVFVLEERHGPGSMGGIRIPATLRAGESLDARCTDEVNVFEGPGTAGAGTDTGSKAYRGAGKAIGIDGRAASGI